MATKPFNPLEYGAKPAATSSKAFDPRALGAKPVAPKPAAPAPTPPAKNLGDYTADAYMASGQKIVESVTRAADKISPSVGSRDIRQFPKVVGALGEGLLGAASGAIQGFFAPVSGALGKLGDFAPKRTESFDAAQMQAQTSGMISKPSTNVVTGSQPNAHAQFAQSHPDAARNLSDAFVVGSTVLGGTSGLLGKTVSETTVGQGLTATKNAIVGGTKATASAIAHPSAALGSLTTRTEQQIESTILKTFEKGVKPNLPGKTTPAKLADYRDDVVTAVKTIKDNKANLRFADDAADGLTEPIVGQNPRSLQQLTDAVEQTKKTIFGKYDALAQQAGKAGVGVKTQPIASELDAVISSKALALTNPKAVEYAKQLQDRLNRIGDLDAMTAQEAIQNYNKSLEAFYRNPTYETSSQAAIDAMVANRMRQSLDDGISGLTGESYKALKSQYGSLKAIERDVIKATLRDTRKNIKGLIDYTDIFSGGQVVTGILTLNPAVIASGATSKGIASFYKWLNNPNRAIEKMFNAADNLPQTSRPRLNTQAATMQSTNTAKSAIPESLPQKSTTPPGAPKSVPSPKPTTLMDKAKNVLGTIKREGQKGMIKNPFAKGKEPKIHADDLATMSDYTDYVAGSYKPKPQDAHQLELDITRLWEQYLPDIKIPKTKQAIANQLGVVLEKKGFLTEQPRTPLGLYDTKKKVVSEPLGTSKPNVANGDKKAPLGKSGAWPTTASKPSKAGSTSTGSAPTGKEGVSAQRAGTSGPFEGSAVSPAVNKVPNRSGDVSVTTPVSKKSSTAQGTEEVSHASNYTMSHRPSKTGGTAADISNKGEVIPSDVYDHPEWYANMKDKTYQESFAALKAVRGKPDAEITIYRAAPKNQLNEGDWVTLSKSYAKQESLSENTPVHSFKVKAKDIQFAGDDINEFGYWPSKPSSPSIPKELEPLAAEAGPQLAFRGGNKSSTATIKGGRYYAPQGEPIWFSPRKEIASNYGDEILSADLSKLRFLQDGSAEFKKVNPRNISIKSREFHDLLIKAGYDGLKMGNGDFAVFNPQALKRVDFK